MAAIANGAVQSSGGNGSAVVVTPAWTAQQSTLATLAAQQGVLLDTFYRSGDVDDTASLNRAVASGSPILLGPRTYIINNFNTGSTTSFILRGIPGSSIIKRTSAAGSQFFYIGATFVYIDGVIFDMNRASVPSGQWGVYIKGWTSVSVSNSTFENNSGTVIGSCLNLINTGTGSGASYSIHDNQLTNCDWISLYAISASHGLIQNNYIHDNAGDGIYLQSNGPASSGNLITDVSVDNNTVERNTTGISVGGYSPQYSFTYTPATYIRVTNNRLIDNSIYCISLEGDYLSAVGNNCSQSSSSVTVYGGIDTLSRYALISDNTVTLSNVGWGIDIGGSVQNTVTNNVVTMSSGTAVNVGGNQNSVISHNHVIISGTATGISAAAVESGGGAVFPTMTSGLVIEENTIDITGTTASGIKLVDNVGGFSGSTPSIVRQNSFNVSGSGTSASQDIIWYGTATSAFFDGNLHNGSNRLFADPGGNGDVVFDNVYYGGYLVGSGSTNDVIAITPRAIDTYGYGQNVLWIMPTSGGSGYTSATTLTVSGTGGGSGWSGSVQIIGGVIVGIRTNTFGTYTGTITATATDSGGGTGAVFQIGTTPALPVNTVINYSSSSNHLLRRNGSYTTLVPGIPIEMQIGTMMQLRANSNNSWNVFSAAPATFAIGSLPACNSYSNGATINITGSTTSKWQARCNGTNWLWPDSSIVSG